MASDVSGPGGGLMTSAPGGPVQGEFDGSLVAGGQVEESADFGDGDGDEATIDLWGSGRVPMFSGFVGRCQRTAFGPPFLVLCAVTARKVWASMDRVICLCQAVQVRTW